MPLAAIPLVLLVALCAQIPLAFIMRRHMRESNLKHGLLIESIEGTETLKTLGAEGVMQGRWENYTAITGKSAVAGRMVSSAVLNFAQMVIQAVTIGIVVWGVYLIAAGEITTGVLIACVILSNRGMAPLAQLAGILTRYQHARAAYISLDGLMRRPLERPRTKRFTHRAQIEGGFEFKSTVFSYPGEEQQALRGVDIRIDPGERVAILGRVGSGKSTLLKLMLKLYSPSEGSVLIDGIDLSQFDPAELRRHIGYVSQEVRLFYGTLRDNIALGSDFVEDRDVVEAAQIAGLESTISQHPSGFGMTIMEGGVGLSGGQKGAVGLARALVRKPRIYVFDEPTASMDHSMEQAFIARMRPLLEGRTLILVTHKPTLLSLVDRVVVLEQGKVLADGPRDKVMAILTGNASAADDNNPLHNAAKSGPVGVASNE